MTSTNRDAAPLGAVSRVCHLCGSGPRLPHCDAKIHTSPRERASAPSHLPGRLPAEILEPLREELNHANAATFPDVLAEPVTKSTSPTPSGNSISLGELLEADAELKKAREVHEAATSRRLEVVARLRRENVTLETIAGALGISKAGAQQLVKRAQRGNAESGEVGMPQPSDGAQRG